MQVTSATDLEGKLGGIFGDVKASGFSGIIQVSGQVVVKVRCLMAITLL